jgi:hypothetical protein
MTLLGRTLRNAFAAAGRQADLAWQIHRLEAALWGGLSNYAAPRLEEIAATAGDAATRSAAAYALARWRLERDDHGAALKDIARADPPGANAGRLAVLEAHARLLAGSADTLASCERIREALGEGTDYWLALANAALADGDGPARGAPAREWLARFNRPLVAAGVSPLALDEGADTLGLDTIAAASMAVSAEAGERPLISVLMPAFNAAATLGFAIRSLTSQTWRDIEIIIVDDCSTDDSWSLVTALAAADARIVALRHAQNRGTYPAMNTALARATGAFVTTHGADDWSHPEKLERQVLPLLRGEADCSMSFAARISAAMRVELRARTASYLAPNVSSLLFRRRELHELGGWDEVRADADAEIYARYRARFRKERLGVLPDAPLALASARRESLTRSGAIGLASIGYGARRQYREAYSHWHRLEAARETPDLRCGPGRRPFPAPQPLLSRSPKTRSFDVVVVSDFALGGGQAAVDLALLRRARESGLQFGVFHWPTPASAGRSIDRAVRAHLHAEGTDSIVAGEAVRASLAIVSCAATLRHYPDTMPDFTVENVLVRASYPFSAASALVAHARKAFGRAPVFVPASRWLRALLRARHRPLSLHRRDWASAFHRLDGVFARLAARRKQA